jgi:hypothetical protein
MRTAVNVLLSRRSCSHLVVVAAIAVAAAAAVVKLQDVLCHLPPSLPAAVQARQMPSRLFLPLHQQQFFLLQPPFFITQLPLLFH